MDITEMLSLLVLDLKMTLDSEISTAEGTRAIHRAVDELSRHIPRERIYEHTWVESVTDDSFTTPATASATSLVDAMDISASVDGDLATLVTSWNDVPRPVKMTITDANNSITRMTLIVKGTDADGVYREERFYRHNGKTQTGKIYFSSIYEIEINEINGNGAADTLSVGTDSPDLATGGVWLQLDNPIKPESESIYSGAGKTGTKYTLDTDYEMDYANGRIRMKNGGSLSVSTTYYANYDKAQTAVDISGIIPDLIRIVKVVYPVDKIPEQSVSFHIWENMLIIGSPRPGVSQEALDDGEHIAVYYEARQTPPTLVSSGSYPEFLDEVVLMGAAGYSLLMEALQHELQASTDIASMRTELGLTTAVHTSLANALTDVEKYLDNNSGADAAGMLEDITTNVAEIRTKIITALGAMATNLGLVFTNSLDKATTGAEAYLDTGDDLINRLNDGGDSVPSIYSDYSRTRTQIAAVRIQAVQSYAQEAQMRFSDLQAYIQESSGYRDIALGFISKAQMYLGQIQQYLAEATQYQEAAGLSLLLADRLRNEAQSRLNDFRTVLSSKAEYRKRVSSTNVRQPA